MTGGNCHARNVTHRSGDGAHRKQPQRKQLSRPFRWAGWSLAALAVAGIAFGGYRLVDQMTRPAQEPNLAAFVQSPAVQTADQAAAAWLDRQSDRLEDRATWLTLAGHALSDECAASAGVDGLFGHSLQPLVSCHRSDTWYFAARRRQQTEIRDLEKVLGHSGGWGRFASVPPGHAARPALPVTTGSWTGQGEKNWQPPGGRVVLSMIWVARKDQLAAAALGALSRVTADRIRYLHVSPPNLNAVTRRSFGAHRRVVVVAFDDSYFTSSGVSPANRSGPRSAGLGSLGRLAAVRRRDGRLASVT